MPTRQFETDLRLSVLARFFRLPRLARPRGRPGGGGGARGAFRTHPRPPPACSPGRLGFPERYLPPRAVQPGLERRQLPRYTGFVGTALGDAARCAAMAAWANMAAVGATWWTARISATSEAMRTFSSSSTPPPLGVGSEIARQKVQSDAETWEKTGVARLCLEVGC